MKTKGPNQHGGAFYVYGSDQMASHLLAIATIGKARFFPATDLFRNRAAGAEHAAGWRIERGWQISVKDGHFRRRFRFRVRDRHRRNQRFGVGVAGARYS